jgi:hypothetical protein
VEAIDKRAYSGVITSHRELSAYEDEKAGIEQKRADEEDTLLDLLVTIEGLQADQVQAREASDRISARREEELPVLQAREDSISSELPGLYERRKEMVGEFPVYVSTAEIRIEVTEEQKWDVVEQAVAHFKKDHDVIDVDGARVLFGDGWALLRTSNTQPVIVARFEARTEDRLKEIRDEIAAWLADQGVALPESS